MARSKDPSKRDRQRESRDELIRHHLEEASVHIRAAQVAVQDHAIGEHLSTITRNLNRLHRKYGGIPHD